jgi:hypothetical protein
MLQITFHYAADSESLLEILDKTTESKVRLQSERRLLQNAAKEMQRCNPVACILYSQYHLQNA